MYFYVFLVGAENQETFLAHVGLLLSWQLSISSNLQAMHTCQCHPVVVCVDRVGVGRRCGCSIVVPSVRGQTNRPRPEHTVLQIQR